MINGPGVFDLVDQFKKACDKGAAEGKWPAVGSKVRVLQAFRDEDEKVIRGRVGIVEHYYMTGATGAVNFKGKVTKEYSWFPGDKINVQQIFPVNDWEPVSAETPLGPERHYKLRRKKRAK